MYAGRGSPEQVDCPASHSPVLLLLGSDKTSHLRLLGGKGGAESGPPRWPFYGPSPKEGGVPGAGGG